jgi:uncharacterized protein YjiS (DUF1127 family)
LYQYKSQEAAMTRSESTSLPFRARPSLVARFTLAVTRALTRRRDRQLLARLDAHILRDIGLSSDQAATEAGKPFWRP